MFVELYILKDVNFLNEFELLREIDLHNSAEKYIGFPKKDNTMQTKHVKQNHITN